MPEAEHCISMSRGDVLRSLLIFAIALIVAQTLVDWIFESSNAALNLISMTCLWGAIIFGQRRVYVSAQGLRHDAGRPIDWAEITAVHRHTGRFGAAAVSAGTWRGVALWPSQQRNAELQRLVREHAPEDSPIRKLLV